MTSKEEEHCQSSQACKALLVGDTVPLLMYLKDLSKISLKDGTILLFLPEMAGYYLILKRTVITWWG